MNDSQRIVITKGVERVVTVRQAGRVVEVRQQVSPRMTVVSVGVQGPAGALSAEVQQRLQRAESSAVAALELASDTSQSMAALMDDLQGAFTYHAGVISAQGG